MKLSLLAKLAPFYFIIIGIFAYWFYSNTQAKQIVTPNVEISTNFSVSAPSKVLIPSLGLALEIEDGNYDAISKSWNVSSNKAQFVSVSELPNPNSGNTVIYAHNTKNLFGQTSKLAPGDVVQILTKNNNLLEYKFVNYKLVNPKDVSVLENSKEPKLTLITCWGLLNEKRKIMNFEYIKTI